MFFGATSFASTTFAGAGGGGIVVIANGNRLNITIGNAIADITVRVDVTGYQINLASNTVDVINWNPIDPNATGVWVPIDPNNP